MNMFNRFFKSNTNNESTETVERRIEHIFKKIFQINNINVSVKLCSELEKESKINSIINGIGFNTYSKNSSSNFTCLKASNSSNTKDSEINKLLSLPKIEDIIHINYKNQQYILNSNFRFEFVFNTDNKRDILFRLDESEVFEIVLDSLEKFYFIIDRKVVSRVNNLLNRSNQFNESVNELVFSKKQDNSNEQSIHLKIDNNDEFMVGRFFLPKIISNKPVLTETTFKDIKLMYNADYYNKWSGLCFEITFCINGESFNVFYLFDLIDSENSSDYESMFTKLLKIIFKSNIKNLKECDISITKITASVIDKPTDNQIIESIQLRYYLSTEESMVCGRIFIPLKLISYILLKIAPPWSIDYTLDTLENRLKSFLCLNRELYSQGRLSLVNVGIYEEKKSNNPITDLKLNFIKLHQVMDLLSNSEAKKIISNYLYNKGWSGRKLRNLFYYSVRDSFNREVVMTYPVALFNEEKFKDNLMNNMLDEWLHSHDTNFNSENNVYLDHFHILRDMYINSEFKFSTKLRTILNECFSTYFNKVDSILSNTKSLNYISANNRTIHMNRVAPYFNDNHFIKTTFYYFPEHIGVYAEVLNPNQQLLLSRIEIDPPKHNDDWLENYIDFRNK